MLEDLIKNLKEEMMGMSIENDLQVVAIARTFEECGEGSGMKFDSMRRFKDAVYEAFENGSVDLNNIGKNTLDLDYFNKELKVYISNLGSWNSWDALWAVKRVLIYDGLQWSAYKYCFNDGKYDELFETLKMPDVFNKLAVEVFEYELKKMNVVGYDDLSDYFRGKIASAKMLDDATYYYNMFALVFTFIYNLEKGGEEND